MCLGVDPAFISDVHPPLRRGGVLILCFTVPKVMVVQGYLPYI